jgi:hypothetical protein
VRTKRFLIALSLSLIIGVVFFQAYFGIPVGAISRVEAEREIYSALISENYIFEEQTTLGELDLSEETVQYIKGEAPGIKDDSLADFQENNSQSYPLKDYLPTNTNYVFVGDREVEQFYNDWEAFSKQHPNAHVINSFSRIGFNSTFTQAIVWIGSEAKTSDAPFEYTGDGLIYVFRRIGNRWIEQYQVVVSISG